MKKYRVDVEKVYHDCFVVEADDEDGAGHLAQELFDVSSAEQVSSEATNIVLEENPAPDWIILSDLEENTAEGKETVG